MNIAIIIPSLGGGGAERVAQRLGNYYAEYGYNVYYFLLNDHINNVYNVKGVIVQTGIIPATVGLNGGMREFLYRLWSSAGVIRTLKKKYKIDAAISFMEECNYLNILSQRGEKIIVRVCTILSMRNDMNRYLYDRRVIRFFYSIPCKIVVMSKFAKRDLEDFYKIESKKIFIIPNYIDKKQQNDICLYNRRACHTVITVGRLEPVKQQDRIIRAFAYTLKYVPDAELFIVGRGDNERYLKHISKILNIENKVKLTGFCRNVWEVYDKSDCFVLASKVEGFPNAMIEAMASGIPVVSTESPGGIVDILGKEVRPCENYIMCKYGLKTKSMPLGNVKITDDLTVEEKMLGKAIADMLLQNNMRTHYSNMSRIRACSYREDRILPLWDRVIGK